MSTDTAASWSILVRPGTTGASAIAALLATLAVSPLTGQPQVRDGPNRLSSNRHSSREEPAVAYAKRMVDTYPLSFTVWVMPTRDGQANQLWVHNSDQPAIDAVMGG
jgi:hypothetical protein